MILNWMNSYQYGLLWSLRLKFMWIVARMQYFRLLLINLEDKWLFLIVSIPTLLSAIHTLTLNWRILELVNSMKLCIMRSLEGFQKKSTCLRMNLVYYFTQSIGWESMKVTAIKMRIYRKSNIINSKMCWSATFLR